MSEAMAATSRNHLVIGLGGTGGRVIRALRKRIWQLHRSHNFDGVHLEYLYVDSSPEMMRDDDQTWRTLGENVQLPRGSRLLIGGARVWDVLNNRRAFPAIAPWIGDQRSWGQVPQNVIDAGAGGQRRRLGRFLFAMKAPQFRGDVRSLLGRLREASQNSSVHIHLVTGLAGGTGGGSFIDAILTLANDRQGMGPGSKISLLALLPERASRWNDGNYYANGYAALRELNALLIGGERGYRPHDLTGSGERHALPPECIAGIYLCTNENAAGTTIDVGREIPPMIADFLLERITESSRQNAPIFTNENRNMAPETIPGTRIGVRARSFFAFGIKRVEYPQEEIEEYLTHSLVRSSVLALLYNNWSDAFGYVDRPTVASHRARAEDPEFLEQWQLSDAFLRSEQPVLAEDKARAERDGWRPNFRTEWKLDGDHVQSSCEEQKYGRAEMLPRFSEQMEEAYDRGFRLMGVPAFFGDRQRDARVIARSIREGLESDLLRRWREGRQGWSLGDIVATLEALRASLNTRRANLGGSIEATRSRVEQASAVMEEIADEVSRIGGVMWTFKRANVLARYADASLEHFVARTELLADQTAVELIPALQQELASLETQAGDLRKLFDEALKEALDKIAARMRANSTAVTEADRYFDPARVVALAEQIARDKSEMSRLTASIQENLLDTPRIRESTTFGTILQELGKEALDQRVFQECNRQVERIHDRFAPNENERVLGIRLLQRLRADLGNDREKMTTFVRGLVDKARPFVRYDESQRIMAPGAVGAPPEAAAGGNTAAVVLQRPHPAELDAFGKRLDNEFREATLNIEIPEDSTSRDNALSVIALDSMIPARFLSVVGYLKEEYEKRTANLNPVAKLEVHSEDEAADLPDLFPEVAAPKKAGTLLLLARALKLVFEDKDQTGRREVVLSYSKEGYKHRDKLASSLDELPEGLSQTDYITLEQQVMARLSDADLRHVEDRRRLDERVGDLVREIESTKGEGSLEYAKARNAAIQARSLLDISG